MKQNIKFVKPNDLSIVEGSTEFILRKGFLHVNELILDKKNSSSKFVKMFEEFIKNEKISINSENEEFDSFMKLVKFGLINFSSSDNYLIITNSRYLDFICKIDNNIECNISSEILNTDEIDIINSNKDENAIKTIANNVKDKLEKYSHIYYLDNFCEINSLRAFNRIFYENDMESTFGIIDNDNIYLTGIKPYYSGCYECLEKYIISKFAGCIDDYVCSYDYTLESLDMSSLIIIIGLILKDIENINKYGSSSLMGNVIHMYTPNFEYQLDANFRHSGCTTCSCINKIHFDEQNIKAVNVIKETLKDAN